MHDCDHCYDLGVREGYRRGYEDGAKAVAADVGLPMMASGGLVTRPTVALLGEAGPELVIPVKKKPMKKSPYRKELTRQQAIVQKKHPRMSFKAKSKEAHRLTRKKLGIRKKRS